MNEPRWIGRKPTLYSLCVLFGLVLAACGTSIGTGSPVPTASQPPSPSAVPSAAHTASPIASIVASASVTPGPVRTLGPKPSASAVPEATGNGRFDLTGSMSVARAGHTATLLADGRVLIAGGSSRAWGGPSLASAELYDPKTRKFSPTGSMHFPRTAHTATLLQDGRVLIAGGTATSAPPDVPNVPPGQASFSAELYDPASGQFSLTGSMKGLQFDHSATLLWDGRVLIAGGLGDATPQAYDPATGTFNAVGSADLAVGSLAALLPDGRVLFADETCAGLAQLYDPRTDTFAFAASSSIPGTDLPEVPGTTSRACGPPTILQDGHVLLAGGQECDPLGCVDLDSADLYDPGTGKFLPTGSMFKARDGHTSTLLSDGRVLIAGDGDFYGCDRSHPCRSRDANSAELYEPLTGRFSPASPMNAGRFDHTATSLRDGRVLIVGGWSGAAGGAALSSAEVYNPAPRPSPAPMPIPASQGMFSPTGSMSVLRSGHTATLLRDGRVLIVGRNEASAELYDPKTGRFGPTGSMSIVRADVSAVRLADGRVLILDEGFPWGVMDASAELYDPATGTFSPTGPTLVARPGATATLLPDGRVLVAGGFTGSPGTDDYQDIASAELYDPKTGEFSRTGSMSIARSGHTATLLRDGRVLVAGGDGASAEIYDPTTGRFSRTGSMSVVRSGHTAALLHDGRVLVAGGSDADPAKPEASGSAELYNPATGKFTRISPPPFPYAFHIAVVLSDGRVLMLGGVSDPNEPNEVPPTNSAALYDSATGTFSFAGWLCVKREEATATLLADGRVLISGGWVDPEGPVNSAEIYTP